ncbi:MAG: 30S ribosomal protein S2 [Candidatus Levybacteria bacterium]|nr:30S ribosomal protein S2 [Candidatus Levybacteria bacterium]
MRTVTLEELLEAGCHFGHQVTRQNPKARDFVFDAREGIHIIDLEKTKQGLEEAAAFIKSLASRGGTLILIGTKRQARSIILAEFERVKQDDAHEGLFIVTQRWIGGIMTNFDAVSKNFEQLRFLTKRLADKEEKEKYTKKEMLLWERDRQKLDRFYGGIADLKSIPDAVFIIDTHLEDLAVAESKKMGVTTVGIVDTNADPEGIDYPIPANDDAVGSIKLITSYMVDAWIEGKKHAKNAKDETHEKREKEVTKDAKPEKKKVITRKTQI